MFTGLIEGIGTIERITRMGSDSACIALKLPENMSDNKIGDSIAVNGVCLTITTIEGLSVSFDVSAETIGRTTLEGLKSGDGVNLERAMKLGDRLGGHLVQGHVDGIGKISRMTEAKSMITIGIDVPAELERYMVDKGSVAIDGISLTIARISGNNIEIAVIPETLKNTNLGSRQVGDKVNLEVDLIAKYVEKLHGRKSPESKLDLERLEREGF